MVDARKMVSQVGWALAHQYWIPNQPCPARDYEELVHHGGTYTLNGDEYVENVKYATENTTDLIGEAYRFKVKVEGDTFTNIGIGNPWTEVWKRAKWNGNERFILYIGVHKCCLGNYISYCDRFISIQARYQNQFSIL